MADNIGEEPTNSSASVPYPVPQQQQQQRSSTIFRNIMSKRRTWVFLFISVYTILLSISWNILISVLSWYEITMVNSSSKVGSGWAALYTSVSLGVAFGALSVVAALAVAVPATLVTWITILVLLTFFGKPKRVLVSEGRKLTGEITRSVIKVLIKEGNIVAVLCAVLGYFAFIRKSNENGVVAASAAKL